MVSWYEVRSYEIASSRHGGVEASNEITLNKRGGAARRGGGTLTCARGRLPVISLETGESSWLPYLVREPFSRCFVSSSLWHRLWRPPPSPSVRPILFPFGTGFPPRRVRVGRASPVLCPSFSPANCRCLRGSPSISLSASLFSPPRCRGPAFARAPAESGTTRMTPRGGQPVGEERERERESDEEAGGDEGRKALRAKT